MLPILAFTMITLFLKYGNSFVSPFTYALYGVMLGAMGDISLGYRYGRLAMELTHRFKAREALTMTHTIFYVLIYRWKVKLKDILEPLLETYQKALEAGDFTNAAANLRSYCSFLFFSGGQLETVEQECTKYGEKLERLKEENQLYSLQHIREAALNLMGLAENRTHLVNESFNEEVMLPVLIEANNTDGIAGVNFIRCMLCYLFEDYKDAFESFQKVQKHHETRGRFGFVLDIRIYYSLIILAVYPGLKKRMQKRYMRKLDSYQKMMRKWAEHAPMNYLHKWQLIEAERARVMQKDIKAMELYDLAIEIGRAHV